VRPTVCPPAALRPPTQTAIALAIDVVTVTESILPHVLQFTTVEFDMVIRAERFEHGIKALPGPGQQVTQLVDGHPVVPDAEAAIGMLELGAGGMRLEEAGTLLLVSEPRLKGGADSGVP
jgi:hypothetical protein